MEDPQHHDRGEPAAGYPHPALSPDEEALRRFRKICVVVSMPAFAACLALSLAVAWWAGPVALLLLPGLLLGIDAVGSGVLLKRRRADAGEADDTGL